MESRNAEGQPGGRVVRRNLTEVEAAKEWGPSVHWFRRARWAGGGPRFIKLGGKVLYPQDELEAFFASRLRRSTSDPGRDNGATAMTKTTSQQ